jgi:hypothetical protein
MRGSGGESTDLRKCYLGCLLRSMLKKPSARDVSFNIGHSNAWRQVETFSEFGVLRQLPLESADLHRDRCNCRRLGQPAPVQGSCPLDADQTRSRLLAQSHPRSPLNCGQDWRHSCSIAPVTSSRLTYEKCRVSLFRFPPARSTSRFFQRLPSFREAIVIEGNRWEDRRQTVKGNQGFQLMHDLLQEHRLTANRCGKPPTRPTANGEP